jgi:basic amino acid/polyamine antiporter, APA family
LIRLNAVPGRQIFRVDLGQEIRQAARDISSVIEDIECYSKFLENGILTGGQSVTINPPRQTVAPPRLARAVGWISLEAIALNGMIGAGIFALPATVSQLLGQASAIAYVSAGLAVLLIALCFAELGSIFDRSGGPYLYAQAAFGSFVGFEVGWMFVLARLTSVAAISNTFTSYLGYFFPAVSQGAARVIAITILIVILTAVHCVGVRPGVRVLNFLTVGKLIPLLAFCGIGLFFINWHGLALTTIPKPGPLQQASLLLLFAFGGFEYASVPSGEVIRSKRVLPLVLVSAVAIVVGLYMLIQIVAMGTLPVLATSKTPLTSAALLFLGPVGAVLLTAGAVVSASGTASAAILVGSRMLHSLAEHGQLPAVLARVHDRYRTPTLALVLFAFVAWIFAVSGTFVQLAAVSAFARLLYYTTTCVAVPVLRRKMPGIENRFLLPGGLVLPVLGLGACLWLLIGSSFDQASIVGASLLIGAALYAIGTQTKRSVSGTA